MSPTAATVDDPLANRNYAGSFANTTTSPGSAVSWGAVVAGASATATLSLILLILGAGLGLSLVSPWSREGMSSMTLGVSAIVWLTLTQLLAAALGGYLAGRLRTKWSEVHSDERYFRDTAHGFLAWAVATLLSAALLTGVIASIVNSGMQAGASMVGGMAGTASSAMGAAAMARMGQGNDAGTPGATGSTGATGIMGYFIDSLFRRDASTATPATPGAATAPSNAQANERNWGRDTAEVSRIFMNITRSDPLPAEDLKYVGQLVAQRTGLPQQEAEKRVTDVYAKAQAKLRDAEMAARDAADKARKASAYSAMWLFVSLLIGAFVASWAATFGGRRRDA
ncbi:MAG: hypothetical protein ORN29_06005 [Rhodoferax sp.]|nr:hypothetical protein [Rhodoferax sp.]